VQRRQVLVDLHGHDGVGVVVQIDVGDRADRLAADAHLVARHELPGVVEDGVDGVRGAPAEHGEGGQRYGGDERGDRDYAGDRRSPLVMERFTDPSLSLIP
jgi:hypothetical protein